MERSCERLPSVTAKVRWCLHSTNCSLLENSFSQFSWRSKARGVLPGWLEVYISSSGLQQLLAFSYPYHHRTLRRRVYGILFNEHHRVFTQVVFILVWHTYLLHLHIFFLPRAGRRKSW